MVTGSPSGVLPPSSGAVELGVSVPGLVLVWSALLLQAASAKTMHRASNRANSFFILIGVFLLDVLDDRIPKTRNSSVEIV